MYFVILIFIKIFFVNRHLVTRKILNIHSNENQFWTDHTFRGYYSTGQNSTYQQLNEGNSLSYNTLNTFYLRSDGIGHMVTDHPDTKTSYWSLFMGYSYQITAWEFSYGPSYRQDSTYHGRWYTSYEGNILFNDVLNIFYGYMASYIW